MSAIEHETRPDVEQGNYPAAPPSLHDSDGKRSPIQDEKNFARRKNSSQTDFSDEKHPHHETAAEVMLAHELAKDEEEVEAAREHRHTLYMKLRPFILVGLMVLILGWWISSLVLPATRHRWIPQTVWAWFFIL